MILLTRKAFKFLSFFRVTWLLLLLALSLTFCSEWLRILFLFPVALLIEWLLVALNFAKDRMVGDS